MNIDLCFLPAELAGKDLSRRAIVVFDVLRATSTIAAGLEAGVADIRVFDSLQGAKDAAAAHGQARILCGEEKCLPPAGFDLGNSPGAFNRQSHHGATVFMATTNGTRALVAARNAKVLMAGALVNASSVARQLAGIGLDVTLLCAGTNANVAMEDVLGAGAVAEALARMSAEVTFTDAARIGLTVFSATRHDLPTVLSQTLGGQNVISAGLAPDIDFAARVDAINVVPFVDGKTLVIRSMQQFDLKLPES